MPVFANELKLPKTLMNKLLKLYLCTNHAYLPTYVVRLRSGPGKIGEAGVAPPRGTTAHRVIEQTINDIIVSKCYLCTQSPYVQAR